ncbi:hypothetical protein ACVWZ8_004346 [Arthrobacter sp. UYCu723]
MKMEQDGKTAIVYTPDTAAGIRAALARVLGQAPTVEWARKVPRPSNERPWHKHTLPNRRRR